LATSPKAALAQSGWNYSQNTRQKFTGKKVHPVPLLVTVGHAFETVALDLYGHSWRWQRPKNGFAGFLDFIVHPSTIYWK
jgi:hypothetical protein